MISRIPEDVLAQWHAFSGQSSVRSESGLINDTFVVVGPHGSKAVFQRLHPIFDAEVNLDIAAITRRLSDEGIETPRLIPTDGGALWVVEDDRVWRALTFVPGQSHHKITEPALAREAGALVGRFHRALADFEHDYHFTRGNVHDTAAHLETLRSALAEHDDHPLRAQVSDLAGPLLKAAEQLPDLSDLPARHSHGDLKISNVLFDESRHAVCLIDLDTLSQMIWPFEMGDALRSWCNPREEDERPACLELELMDAALAGYGLATPGFLTPEEREALVAGLAQICLELSARFLADALNEHYFGWDRARYRSGGEHNLARGRAMWELYESVEEQRSAAERIVRERLV